MKTGIETQPDKGDPLLRCALQNLLSRLAWLRLMVACVPLAPEETSSQYETAAETATREEAVSEPTQPSLVSVTMAMSFPTTSTTSPAMTCPANRVTLSTPASIGGSRT